MKLISYFSTTSVSVLYFVFAYTIFRVQKTNLTTCSLYCIVFIYSSKIIIDTSFVVCYNTYNFIMTGDHPI